MSDDKDASQDKPGALAKLSGDWTERDKTLGADLTNALATAIPGPLKGLGLALFAYWRRALPDGQYRAQVEGFLRRLKTSESPDGAFHELSQMLRETSEAAVTSRAALSHEVQGILEAMDTLAGAHLQHDDKLQEILQLVTSLTQPPPSLADPTALRVRPPVDNLPARPSLRSRRLSSAAGARRRAKAPQRRRRAAAPLLAH